MNNSTNALKQKILLVIFVMIVADVQAFQNLQGITF